MENEEKMIGETPVVSAADETAQVAAMTMEEMQRLEEQMKLRQNMPKGVLASVVVGLGCAALWAFITALTGYQIGYMAWGVGLAVGATMKAAGKGLTPAYGIVAAVIALLACLIGNFMSYLAFLAIEFGASFGDVLREFDYSYTFGLMRDAFDVMDVVFYILAVSTAFSMGFIRNKDKAAK